MPPKNNSAPINPSENSTMTHEEEELQYDISKLWYQVQQISILQREIKDDIYGLKEKLEANLDGLKDQMKDNIDDKVVEDHIKHQQQSLQLSNDNLTLVQNQMKQHEDQHRSERISKAITEKKNSKNIKLINFRISLQVEELTR